MSKQDQGNGRGLYVYCVAETAGVQRIAANALPTPIEENAAIELIAGGDLTAVTSVVSLSTYGEESLAEHLGDAAWTAVRAMRHEHVVEHFAKRTSVVPLRFGTIYLERANVEQMLSDRAAELTTIIERIRDREEWGVNVFCDRAKLIDAIAVLSPRLRKLSEEARKASPGQAYLLQKKLEGQKTDEARNELTRMVDEIESKLGGETDGAKRLRVLKVEATESGELKAKFAFLVERSKFDRFRATAEQLAREVKDAGVRLELTGPWPAYNFAMSDKL
jgi:Gas vesicle synthesis protein GvpL/GvpF